MDVGIAVLAGLALIAAMIGRGQRGAFRALAHAAGAAGLEDVRLRSVAGWARSVEGRAGALHVSIRPFHSEALRTGTRVDVDGLTSDLDLYLSAVKLLPAALRRADIDVGDREFDEIVVVGGQSAVASALLVEPVRRRIRHLASTVVSGGSGAEPAHPLVLANGHLTAMGVVGDQAEWIAAYLRDVLLLADGLRPLPAGELTARLALNAREERDGAVRRACLRLLAREYPARSETIDALERALLDEDERVRLDAAIQLGAEGEATLVEIATSEWSDDEVAAQAIRELKTALPAEQAHMLLARCLRERRVHTAEACLESLGQHGPEEADAIGRVLGAEDGPLAVAAARALARVGTTRSVVELREAEARLSGNAALRQAAREAVAAIQSRLVGADRGQVSLSGEEPGRVSLADSEAGRVSLQEDAGEGKGPA